MLRFFNYALLSFVCLVSCKESTDHVKYHAENWNKRSIDINLKDSLESGKTYLSIYSQIYSKRIN